MVPELKHDLRRVLIAIRAAEAGPTPAGMAEAPCLGTGAYCSAATAAR